MEEKIILKATETRTITFPGTHDPIELKPIMKYKTEPYNHQNDCYNKLYGKESSALFMEQGTGKSKAAIDIACNLFLEKKINAVLLIAPNGVQTQCAEEQIPIHSSVSNNIKVWSNKSGVL